MSTAEKLAATERELSARQGQLQTLEDNVTTLKKQHALRRDVQAEADAENQTARARKVTLHSVGDDARGTLEQCRREQEELKKELESCEEVLLAETSELDSTTAARKGLEEAWSSLSAVRAELEALAGEPAKKAALEAAGGELPTDIVPASAPEVDEASCSKLWSDAEASHKEMSDDLRQALQSQAVIAALQRSLAVRASEMREGLRQWGFASSATVRTEELCKVLEGTQVDNLQKVRTFREELQKLLADQKVDTATLAGHQKEHVAQQQLHTKLLEQLASTRERAGRLQEERDVLTDETDVTERQHEQLNYDHNEAEKELEVRRAALAEHPVEAERRLAAQKRLAEMAHDQAQRSLVTLQQTQEQVISFQQAHQVVQETHAALGDGLLAEKAYLESLRGEHDMMHLELEALARHYIAALPPLPGVGRFADKPMPNSPAALGVSSDAGFITGDSCQAPRALTNAMNCSPGPNSIDRSPEHMRQLSHIDPTGEGALAAGGRLVMSL